MAKAKKRRQILTDDEIVSKVSSKVANSTAWPSSPLAKDNETVIKYYNSELPERQSKGRSSYVSSDVYDAVEMMKAQLLETFAAGREIIRFKPNNAQDIEQAKVETKYVDHVVFSENDGFTVFHDVIHDGLTARKGVAEAQWVEEVVYDTQTFEDLSYDAVVQLAAGDDIEDLEAELDADDDTPVSPAAAVYSGTYRRKIDKSRVVIDPVPPEEYFVERGVKRRELGIRGRRKVVTRADLLAEGYDKAVIDKIQWDSDKTLTLAPEKLAREHPTSSGSTLIVDNEIQNELRAVLLVEAYTKIQIYNDQPAQLWRIVYAGKVLLERDPVDEDPFIEWDPLRVPHTVWGNSYAGRVVQTQNARTSLTRGILDHTSITLNPRWTVVQGGLVNPREMLDNRQGGLVNTTRPDAITPLQYQNLNPFVYQTLEMLKHSKEENTGISALSQGLNKDAISEQNSDAMVDNLISVSQIRQKVMARFFALHFLVPLYLKVLKLVVENEKKEKVFEVAGDFINIDPKTWGTQRRCWLSPHLGYGEAEKEAKKYNAFYTGLSSDPTSARFFLDQQRYRLMGVTAEKNDIPEWADYIAPVEQWAPAQPNPIDMMEAQAKKTTADATMITAQAAQQKAQVSKHREALRTQNDTAQTVANVQKTYEDMQRQNLETVNRVDVEQRKIALDEHMRPKEHEAQKQSMAAKARQPAGQ